MSRAECQTQVSSRIKRYDKIQVLPSEQNIWRKQPFLIKNSVGRNSKMKLERLANEAFGNLEVWEREKRHYTRAD